jgi:hypothetical protein
MRARGVPQALGVRRPTRDKVGRFRLGLPGKAAFPLHHANGLAARPTLGMTAGFEGLWVTKCPPAPDFEPALSLTGGLPEILNPRLEGVLLRPSTPCLYIRIPMARITFARQDIIGLLLNHLLANDFLTAHRINGHKTACR